MQVLEKAEKEERHGKWKRKHNWKWTVTFYIGSESSETMALLPRAVGATSLEMPKATDGALDSMIYGRYPAHYRGWNWVGLKVPSNPKDSTQLKNVSCLQGDHWPEQCWQCREGALLHILPAEFYPSYLLGFKTNLTKNPVFKAIHPPICQLYQSPSALHINTSFIDFHMVHCMKMPN